MQKFTTLITGTTDTATYMAGLFFALIGLAFHFKVKVARRNAISKNTPYHFSWLFFTQDNLVEIVFSVVAILLALRFSVEYAGTQITMFYAFGIGLTFPKFIAFMSKIQGKARI
ncbi:hypothetical protein [Flavobacterium praedii]|uniref:hypothetical protein n=1 Tax=Flavobacterium praedii TaxID=3002900 RepID=UPI002481CB37|nr:hypothetical protein [Flavobacterium praedii]